MCGHVTILLAAQYQYSYEINQHFEIKIQLPEPDDKRTHGYTLRYNKRITNYYC